MLSKADCASGKTDKASRGGAQSNKRAETLEQQMNCWMGLKQHRESGKGEEVSN